MVFHDHVLSKEMSLHPSVLQSLEMWWRNSWAGGLLEMFICLVWRSKRIIQLGGHLRMAARFCVCRALGRKRRCLADSQAFNIGLLKMEESLSLVAMATAICFLVFGGQITQWGLKILRASENLKLQFSFKYIEDRCWYAVCPGFESRPDVMNLCIFLLLSKWLSRTMAIVCVLRSWTRHPCLCSVLDGRGQTFQ